MAESLTLTHDKFTSAVPIDRSYNAAGVRAMADGGREPTYGVIDVLRPRC